MKRALRLAWTFSPVVVATAGFCLALNGFYGASEAQAAPPAVKDPFEAPVAKEDVETERMAQPEATAQAPAAAQGAPTSAVPQTPDDIATCKAQIEKTVRGPQRARLETSCERMTKLPICVSKENRTIGHVDFETQSNDARAQKRILVFGLIHGDEPLAGEMAIEWAERLFKLRGEKIEARNTWRVVPMLNPDGLERKTRMNASGVDLNRNFPTRDWSTSATEYWKKNGKSDPRRFPGEKAGSEVETQCAIAHIKDFKPDFIVSVHTPYHVLDFDGPKMSFPKYKDLPWRALGNFPGSLGRYMWRDYTIPVLTVELGSSMVDAANLQDIVGTFAIDASRLSGPKTATLFERLPSHEH